MRHEKAAFTFFRLLNVSGIGPARVWGAIDLALQHGVSFSDLLDRQADLGLVMNESQLEELRAKSSKVTELWEKLHENKITVISVLDAAYPRSLLSLLGRQSPPILFCRGNLELLGKPSLGFCGSRKASLKGIAAARECAEIASREGINIASGYAAGVDMTTHHAALEAGGTTAVILAEGMLRFRLKKELREVWDWNRAVVVSEYLPRASWNVGNAMRRNRTICALCHAMVLIEARETGGSIEAGRTCLALGIPLFAPVYEGMPESAGGNRILLAEGARSLYKNKTTRLPNLRPVLAALRSRSSEVAESHGLSRVEPFTIQQNP